MSRRERRLGLGLRRLAARRQSAVLRAWGERGARTPVLLCDGIGCDGYVWRYLRADLADRFGLHPHYRGHGRTAPPRDPARVTIEDLADDVACVLDDALVDRAVLIGHSMGVQVALETYRRHPRRVAGLVLVCGAASHPLKTFRGSATLEEMLPDRPEVDPSRARRRSTASPGRCCRPGWRTRSRAGSRSAASSSSRPTSCPTSRAWRGSMRACSSRCCPPPVSTPPTTCCPQ